MAAGDKPRGPVRFGEVDERHDHRGHRVGTVGQLRQIVRVKLLGAEARLGRSILRLRDRRVGSDDPLDHTLQPCVPQEFGDRRAALVQFVQVVRATSDLVPDMALRFRQREQLAWVLEH